MTNTNDEVNVAAPMSTADLRKEIFSAKHTKVKKASYVFNDVKLEFRQPKLENFLEIQREEGSGKNFVVRMMIDHSYIPETDEKIFTEADYDAIVAMPMSAQFTKLMEIVQDMFDIKIEEKAKNSE